MLFYFFTITLVLLSTWFLYAYWQELKYRNKPFYKLSEIGWRQFSPPPQEQLLHAVVLIGDAGNTAANGTDPVLKMLEEWLETAGEHGTVVFLGDNIYPVGMPPETALNRAAAEKKINCQLDLLRKFPARKIYLSGNHDWNKGRKNGYEYLKRQEAYIKNYLQTDDCYLPANGCPGPVTVPLAPGVLLLVINTQWWVQRGDKPRGPEDGCTCENEEAFFRQFSEILRENQHQRILIVAHHPLYSNALHGGNFSVKQHIFPLTAAHKRFYFPLPVAGSLYPMYRRYFGAAEDMAHPRYKRLRKRLLRIIKLHRNIIYAAGHDHNLQYIFRHHNHFIVSGSGSKTNFVKKGGKAVFTHESKGFFIIEFYANGETWMRVLEPGLPDSGQVSNLVFLKKLSS